VILVGLTEQRFVLDGVIHHLEWFSTRELFYQIISPGKDSIETILGNVPHMLLEVESKSHLLQHFLEGLDLHRDVGNSFPQDLREDVSNFILT
jgi:hypothetical protein